MSLRSRFALLASAVATVVSCDNGPSTPPNSVPASLVLSQESVSLTAIGDTVSLVATVRDQEGQVLSGASISFVSSAPEVATVSESGTITALSNGRATIHVASASLTATASVTVVQVITSLAKVTGDAQDGTVGQALPNPLEVEARDARGNAVTGTAVADSSVDFVVTAGGGSLAQASVALGPDGRAAAQWTLGESAGAVQTVSAALGTTLRVDFTAVANAGPVDSTVIVSGDAQTAQAGTVLPIPLSVRLADAFGNAVPNDTVTFRATQGGGVIVNGARASDSLGVASANWTLGNVPGVNEATYSVSGAVRGTFTATGTFGPPDYCTSSWMGVAAPVNTALDTAPALTLWDLADNRLPGVTVTFTVTDGNGSVTGATQVTDDTGYAAVGSWTLGTVAGLNGLIASAGPVLCAFGATGLPGPSANLVKQAGDGQTAAVGTNVLTPPSVLVTDAYANPLPAEPVAFMVTGGGGSVDAASAITDLNGIATVQSWTLGPSPGANTLQATAGALTPVTFDATAVTVGMADMVAVYSGGNQTGLVNRPVNVPPSVVVTSGGLLVANAEVTFAVTAGAGSITQPVVMTDVDGIAQVGSWTLGPALGVNTLTATVTGAGIAGNPVTFDATAQTRQYSVDVRLLFSTTATRAALFDSAAMRWETIIYGDLPNVQIDLGQNTCALGQPAINEEIDDIVIFATVEPIDGPSGTLATAGPCVRRSSDHPVIGSMRFDVDDIDRVEDAGLLGQLIVHEMGHAIGYGALWERFGLTAGSGGPDPHFTGVAARDRFNAIGGTGYMGGQKVPTENTGSSGTREVHWRESVFGEEVMTGFLQAGDSPAMSVVSIASMGDMGYTVDYFAADPFSLTFGQALRRLTQAGMPLGDDIRRGPEYVVYPDGRLVRIR